MLVRSHWRCLRSCQRVSQNWFRISVLSHKISKSWLPLNALEHCLTHTQCKLVILDPERANVLENATRKLTDAGAVAFLVMECHEGKGTWNGMQSWGSAVGHFEGAQDEVIENDPDILPEDNATIIFTSGKSVHIESNYFLISFLLGTTGLPKGVLSTQRMYLTNVFNVCSKFPNWVEYCCNLVSAVNVTIGFSWRFQGNFETGRSNPNRIARTSERDANSCSTFPCYWFDKLSSMSSG